MALAFDLSAFVLGYGALCAYDARRGRGVISVKTNALAASLAVILARLMS